MLNSYLGGGTRTQKGGGTISNQNMLATQVVNLRDEPYEDPNINPDFVRTERQFAKASNRIQMQRKIEKEAKEANQMFDRNLKRNQQRNSSQHDFNSLNNNTQNRVEGVTGVADYLGDRSEMMSQLSQDQFGDTKRSFPGKGSKNAAPNNFNVSFYQGGATIVGGRNYKERQGGSLKPTSTKQRNLQINSNFDDIRNNTNAFLDTYLKMKTLRETLEGPSAPPAEIAKNTRKVGIGLSTLHHNNHQNQQSRNSGGDLLIDNTNNHRGSQLSISPPRMLDRDYESQTMLLNKVDNAGVREGVNQTLTTKSVNSGKNFATSSLGNELKRLDVEKSVNFAMEVLAETFGEAGSPEVRKNRGFGQNNSKSPQTTRLQAQESSSKKKPKNLGSYFTRKGSLNSGGGGITNSPSQKQLHHNINNYQHLGSNPKLQNQHQQYHMNQSLLPADGLADSSRVAGGRNMKNYATQAKNAYQKQITQRRDVVDTLGSLFDRNKLYLKTAVEHKVQMGSGMVVNRQEFKQNSPVN